jgi:hypothetical protein
MLCLSVAQSLSFLLSKSGFYLSAPINPKGKAHKSLKASKNCILYQKHAYSYSLTYQLQHNDIQT